MNLMCYKNIFNKFGLTAMAYDYEPIMKEWRDKLTPTLVQIIDMGNKASISDLIKAQSQRQNIEKIIYQYFKNYDILITPTARILAPLIGESYISAPFMGPFNMSWNPAASIPCGWSSEGLPIGMQIVGKKLDEKTVLQVSKAFEEIAPWQDKKPNFN